MQSVLVFTVLLVSTMQRAHAGKHRNPADKEQVCQRRAKREEAHADHERTLLTRKVHTQGGILAKELAKHNLLDGASQNMFSSRSAPIVGLKVIKGQYEHCSEGWETVSKKNGKPKPFGHESWLCLKRGSYDDEPITELQVVVAFHYLTPCGSLGNNWHFAGSTAYTMGHSFYLCYKRDPKQDPLDKLMWSIVKEGETTCDDGMTVVRDQDNSPAELRSKTFLCTTRAKPPCEGSEVTGIWKYDRMIHNPMDITYEWGTQKSVEETKSKEWAESVSATLEAGFSVGSASVTKSLARTIASSETKVWSTSTMESTTSHYDATAVGKHLWQFEYHVTDTCDNQVNSKTKHLALTRGKDYPPCCLPGYGSDTEYSVCTRQDARIPDAQNCGEEVKCRCIDDKTFACNDYTTATCSDGKECFEHPGTHWVYDLRELGCK